MTLQNRARVYNEATNLSQEYRVSFDLDTGEVTLKNVLLPEGWSPRHAERILMDIPNSYPSEMPEVYVSSDLSYQGSRPHILLSTRKRGYYRFCLHDVEWQPDKHGLASLLRLLMHSFRNPTESARFAEAQ
jgi:hypothetical protein